MSLHVTLHIDKKCTFKLQRFYADTSHKYLYCLRIQDDKGEETQAFFSYRHQLCMLQDLIEKALNCEEADYEFIVPVDMTGVEYENE